MKIRALFIIIIILFVNCTNKKEKLINNDTINDSVDFYFKKIDDNKIDDSLKVFYLKKISILLDKTKKDSFYFKNSYKVARKYYNLKEYEKYKLFSFKLLKVASNQKDTLAHAKANIYIGDYYLKINLQDSSYYYYDRAEIDLITINDLYRVNEVRLNKAVIQFQKKDYLGCETTIYKALPYLKKNNNFISLNIAYTLLGLSKTESLEFEDALQFFDLSLKYAKELNLNTGAIETTYNNIGMLYLKKENYKESISYFENVVKENKNKFNLETYTNAKLNLAYANFKLGKTLNFEKNLQKVIENYKELNISLVIPNVYLSEFYESQNETIKAQKYALEAYNTSIKEKLYRDKLIALKQLTNVFPEKSKYYSNEYIKLSDSIATVDKKVQNTFARMNIE